MGAEETESQANKIPTATYVLAAILAAAAGFAGIYVTFGPYGNAPVEISKEEVKTEPKAVPAKETVTAPAKGGIAGMNKGELASLIVHSTPVELPEVTFIDGDGGDKSLGDWRGKVVLLNLWATWCAPCRKEMPYFDELKAELGGDDFDVVAISIDRGGLDKPRKFLDDIGIKSLKLYNHASGKLAPSLKAFGMPTTLLIDRDGKEIARLVGPAEWHSDDAKALIRAATAKGES